MGGHPWFYFVGYQSDINGALQELRRREFQAGRYNPVMWFPPFPVEANSPAPGAQHRSIEEAMEAADADGTRSILDMKLHETADLVRVGSCYFVDRFRKPPNEKHSTIYHPAALKAFRIVFKPPTNGGEKAR